MGDVQVPSHDDRLLVLSLQLLLQEVLKVLVPRVDAILEPVQPRKARIRHVGGHQDERLEVACDSPPLEVVLPLSAKVVFHRRRYSAFEGFADEDGRTRISFLGRFGTVPELQVHWKPLGYLFLHPLLRQRLSIDLGLVQAVLGP